MWLILCDWFFVIDSLWLIICDWLIDSLWGDPPAINSSLRVPLSSACIERVQKSALAIILSPNYRSYDEALAKTELERLDRRREKLSLNFAKKAAKHPEHSNWFCKQDLNTNMQTRSTKAPYKPVQARTQRLLNSPIPYFTQLLNADATKTNNVPWTLQVLTVVFNMLVLVDNSSRHWYPYQLHLSLSSYWCTVVNHSLLSFNNKPILLLYIYMEPYQ